MLYTQTNTTFTIARSFRNIALTIYGWGSYMIAGGAIRDSLAGKPVKDIDVFYWGDFPDNIKNSFQAVPVDNESYPNELFKCTHKGKFGEYNIDFIQCRGTTDSKTVLESFPCSLSQVCQYAHEENVVRYTRLYKKSHEQQKIYFYEECPEEYVDRITNKYPAMEVEFIDMNPVNTSTAGNLDASFTNEAITSLYQQLLKKTAKPIIKKKYKVINTTKKDCYKEGV